MANNQTVRSEERTASRVRLSHWVQDRCGIQYHQLRADGSIRPGLFYQGWKRRVQMGCLGLEATARGGKYDDRTFWQRMACGTYGFLMLIGFPHFTAARIAGQVRK